MKKTLACVATLAVVLALLTGCVGALGPVYGAITVDLKGPVAVGDPSADAAKVGRAEAQGIILVGLGDASIATAAKNGGITRIHHVDNETLNILGIYCKYSTIVYGE